MAFGLIALLSATTLCAQQWQPVGPEGGSVRSLAQNPKNPDRLFLGTSAGRVYVSEDGGGTWSRFARLGNSAEMVLDHIIIGDGGFVSFSAQGMM